MRVESRKKWFEFKRFHSNVSGYIDIATLDQSQDPNNNRDTKIRLNTGRTWVRSKGTNWVCLRSSCKLYDSLEML